MKLILKYLKRYWIFAVSAPLMMMVEVFMDLMMPTLMARIIDEGIVSQDLTLVLKLGIMMIGVTLIAFIGGAGCSTLSSYASTGLGADLRQDLFKKVLSFSHKNLDRLESGNLITRLTNDVSQLEDVSRMMLRIMVRAPLLIVGSLIMALRISRRLSTLFVVLIPLLLIIVVVLTRLAYPLFYQVQKKIDRMNTRIQENLAGKRLVKAFVREQHEEEKFDQTNQDLTTTTIKANRTSSLMDPAMQIIMNGGIISALWLGSHLMDIKALQIGALIAFINYLRQLLFSLMMFSHLVMRFSRAQASSKRIEEVLNSRADVVEKEKAAHAGSLKGKIEFRDVSFSYKKKGDPVLKNLSFSINPGETAAIIGATGSGKSSIAALIPRFYNLDRGSILMDDKNIEDFSLESLRRQISLVPQQTILFSGTVKDNILYHYNQNQRDSMQKRMEESAADANISDFLKNLPRGFDTDVNQKGVNFSGGQKQRIAIARALAKEAPIVILDDATSAVDMATEQRIYQSLKKQTPQRTTVIIAQRISSIMRADKIIILDDGEIAGIGTHRELLENNPIYREIYYSQVDKEALV